MSTGNVLAYVELHEGKLKRSAWEVLTYARHLAKLTGGEPIAIAIGPHTEELARIGEASISRVVHYETDLTQVEPALYTACFEEVIQEVQPVHLVFMNSNAARALAPYLAGKYGFAVVNTILSLPKKEDDKLVLHRSVYSGKAECEVEIPLNQGVVHMLLPNAISAERTGAGQAEVNHRQPPTTSTVWEIQKVEQATEGVPLTEAEVVVSGGRGMKGPENWHILEELAKELNAALACSKPVTDMGWRPHSEHVGQTGITIRPTLYIAVGISGAIQHMAGVSGSKYILAINKDPEAPIFKYAAFGVVDDLFKVVPKLTEEIRKFKERTGA